MNWQPSLQGRSAVYGGWIKRFVRQLYALVTTRFGPFPRSAREFVAIAGRFGASKGIESAYSFARPFKSSI